MHNEFLHTIKKAGIECLEPIIADGEVHRFASGGKGNKNSWYILFEHGGAFGDWKLGISEKWTPGNQNLTHEQRQAMQDKIRKAKATRDKEIKERQEAVAKQANKDWQKLKDTGNSEYLKIKQVGAYGIKYGKAAIAIPIRDIDGKLWNYQKIYDAGKQPEYMGSRTKDFLKGGKKKACFHVMGDLSASGSIYICEGYATGASIYEATGINTVIAFDAGNLEPVIVSIRSKYPDIQITIAADDDRFKEVNTGRDKAEEASKKHGCNVIFPEFSNTIKKGGSHA